MLIGSGQLVKKRCLSTILVSGKSECKQFILADLLATLLDMVDQLVDEESGIISLYYGSDVKEADATALAEKLQEKYEDLEVELNCGGQPIYYYILSVE